MSREVRPCLIREDFVAICAFVLREALHSSHHSCNVLCVRTLAPDHVALILESIVRRQAEKGGLGRAGDGVGAMGPAPRTQGLSACIGCMAHPPSVALLFAGSLAQLPAQLMWFSALV
jgi:hypothetical protein